jgi:hypothetical protein
MTKPNLYIIFSLFITLSINEVYSQKHFNGLEWDLIKIGGNYQTLSLGTELRYNVSDNYSVSGRLEIAAHEDLISSACIFADGYSYNGKSSRFFTGLGLGYGARALVYVDCEGDRCNGSNFVMLTPRLGMDFNYARILLEFNLTTSGKPYISLGGAFTLGGRFRG